MIVLWSLGFLRERGQDEEKHCYEQQQHSTSHMTDVQGMTLSALETCTTFGTECKRTASTAFVNRLEILFRSSHNALRIG